MKKRNLFNPTISLNKMSTWCRHIASVHDGIFKWALNTSIVSVHEKKKPFKSNTCDVMHLNEIWINTSYLFIKEFRCIIFRASFVQKTSIHEVKHDFMNYVIPLCKNNELCAKWMQCMLHAGFIAVFCILVLNTRLYCLVSFRLYLQRWVKNS